MRAGGGPGFGRRATSRAPHWPIARLQAVTDEELDHDLARPNIPQLVGVAEVAELLGVTKQRVSELVRDHRGFPQPVIKLAATPVWHTAAIQTFLEGWDRRPGPKPARDTPKHTVARTV